MKIAYIDQTLPLYTQCQYAGSRHYLRAPSTDSSDPYIAVLAGSLNFGKPFKTHVLKELKLWLECQALLLPFLNQGQMPFSRMRV